MKKINLFLFICLSVFTTNLFAQRIGSSTELWKTIKTEHFNIIFSAEQQDLGLYYAEIAEKAYQNLRTVFTEAPETTVLVINDSTDSSNGYATRIPYPLIMAYPVQVSDHDSLSEAGEWARELITHEMTHILQFEPAHGFYNGLRPIFGTIVAPNLLTPLWWKEGMAVEMETQFSNGGRSRSYYQDASLRAMLLDKKLFSYTLEQANEVLPSWPYGSRPYLFGSLFWGQITKDYGNKAVDTIVEHQAHRMLYFIEHPMEELSGSTYEINYLKALHTVQENGNQQIEQLQKINTTPFNNLIIEGQSSSQPIFSQHDQLLAYIESKDGENEIHIENKNGELLKHLKSRPTDSIGQIAFHPNQKKIVYSKLKKISSNQAFSDLYIYDIEKDSTEKITAEARARDPHYSDDGEKIVFISTFGGKSQLKILTLSEKKIEIIKEFAYNERVYSPLFWDAKTIFYTKRLADRSQILIRYNLVTKLETHLLPNIKEIHFLRKSGSTLYFTSTENGANNIYQSIDLKTHQPVTNALSGIWSFEINPSTNQLWATIMTGEGFKVASAKLEIIQDNLPKIENKMADRYQFSDKSKSVKIPNAEDYSAADYLLPSYWIPYIAASSSSNGVYFQAQTAGQDPLQIHRYSLLANYQTDINKGGFVGTYTNSAFAVPFQLGALQSSQYFGDVNNILETKQNHFSLIPDMFFISKNLELQIGAQTSEVSYLANITKHWGPFLQMTYLNYARNIFQISPETGWGGFIRYEKNLTVANSEDFNRVYSSLIGFYSYGLPKHHALMSRLNGLFTFENVTERFGSSNTTTFPVSDYLVPEYVIRGYTPSQFYGRSIWTWNTEYRFPVTTLEKGSGTSPYFLKTISGAVVADGLAVKGKGIAEDKSSSNLSLNETFWSAGIEAKLETTIGYVIPMNFILGYYLPFSPKYASTGQMGLSLQIGGL
ncbi:MAG: hypothetical protein WA160_00135 [Pseudobdellovibrio sp.]